MAAVHLVAAAVDQLDDVIAEFTFHHLRNLLRIGKVEGGSGKCRVEHAPSHIAQLASLAGRAGVFRIETCQRGKGGFALCDAVRIVAQLVLDAVDLFRLDLRSLCENLHLHRRRNHRDTIYRKFPEVFPYFGR